MTQITVEKQKINFVPTYSTCFSLQAKKELYETSLPNLIYK